MRYLLIRNEKSVRDVIDNAYSDLSEKARKQAEVALLKANPKLKTFKSVRKGFIVRIPTILEAGKPDRRNAVDPIEAMTHEISENLKLFESSLEKKFSDVENRQKSFSSNLKAASSELEKLPNGSAAAKTLNKYLTDSKKRNDQNKKLGIEALKKLQKAAASFDN